MAISLTARRQNGATDFLRSISIGLLSLIFLLGLWQMVITVWHVPAYLMPAPGHVLLAVGTNWKVLSAQTSFTIGAAALGLTISTTFAVLIAIAFTMSRRLEQASLPAVIAFRSAPVAAVAPIIMLFFGRGITTSVMVVTIVSFFPLLVNLMRGLASTDKNTLELMHVYGATRWQQLYRVRILYALPYLFAGLRVAGTSAILGAMLSEWITGSRGLGNLILESGEMRETELLWAAVLVSVTVALIVFWTTSAAERRVLQWKA